ncbi:polymorphic toxin type 33 domain-containing protein [Snodgrassella alvi]|uniref:polymorphic toxin type 33 domain-containing protein n=1 Tax=Snodgrassella alvi TaxID=1196083 RepID=UPI001C558C05
MDCCYVEINNVNIGGALNLPDPPNPNDPNDQDNGKDNGKDKPRNLQKLKDSYLKKNGYDARKLKADYVGKKGLSKWDLYINKDTKELWIFRKGGTGKGIPTGYYL